MRSVILTLLTHIPFYARVHEYSYLNHLENKCRQAAGGTYQHTSSDSALPYFYAPAGFLDSDTPLSEHSLHAAKMFCGTAMSAVDLIMGSSNGGGVYTEQEEGQRYTKAFVIGRPPGHHAGNIYISYYTHYYYYKFMFYIIACYLLLDTKGPTGCVVAEHHWRRPDMTSSGFCLLNTVAVAAVYTYIHINPHNYDLPYLHNSNMLHVYVYMYCVYRHMRGISMTSRWL